MARPSNGCIDYELGGLGPQSGVKSLGPEVSWVRLEPSRSTRNKPFSSEYTNAPPSGAQVGRLALPGNRLPSTSKRSRGPLRRRLTRSGSFSSSSRYSPTSVPATDQSGSASAGPITRGSPPSAATTHSSSPQVKASRQYPRDPLATGAASALFPPALQGES